MVLVHLPGNTKGENRCTEKNPNSLKDNRGNKGKKKKKDNLFLAERNLRLNLNIVKWYYLFN